MLRPQSPGLCRLRSQKSAENGFTLLEMMVAIAILGGSMAAVFAAFSWSTRTVQQLNFAMQAHALAESILASAIATGNTSANQTGENNNGFSWRIRVLPYGEAAAKIRAALMSADVSWQQHGASRSYSLSSLILLPRTSQ